MDIIKQTRGMVTQLTELALAFVALAIVLTVLVGNELPFFGAVVKNLLDIVASLGGNGLVGLIVLGVILHLVGGREAGSGRR